MTTVAGIAITTTELRGGCMSAADHRPEEVAILRTRLQEAIDDRDRFWRMLGSKEQQAQIEMACRSSWHQVSSDEAAIEVTVECDFLGHLVVVSGVIHRDHLIVAADSPRFKIQEMIEDLQRGVIAAQLEYHGIRFPGSEGDT